MLDQMKDMIDYFLITSFIVSVHDDDSVMVGYLFHNQPFHHINERVIRSNGVSGFIIL